MKAQKPFILAYFFGRSGLLPISAPNACFRDIDFS
jgi:hypothetical protein